MQAITAFAARRSFPPGSTAHRSFLCAHRSFLCPRWVRTLDPPACMEPNAGYRIAQQSSRTCLKPIQPPDRCRRCSFIAQVLVTLHNVKIKHGYSLLLPYWKSIIASLLHIITMSIMSNNTHLMRNLTLAEPHFLFRNRRKSQFKCSVLGGFRARRWILK